MPHYALTDGLLALVCIWSAWRATRMSRHVAAPATLIAALSIGAAALAGTLRFGLNLHAELTVLHQTLSGISGTAGMMCVAMALATPLTIFAMRDHLVHFALSIVMFGVTASAYVFLPGNRLDTLAGPVVILAAVLGGWVHYRNGDRTGTILIAVATLLLVVTGLAIGSGDDLLFGLVARWHVFHVFMAIWMVLFTVAVLRPLPRPASTRQ